MAWQSASVGCCLLVLFHLLFFSSRRFSLKRGELTVSSPLFIVFLQQNKLRFHFVVRETIDKAFWYLKKRHLRGWREVAVKGHRVPDLLL